ncbi:MAG: aldo/keto reductase, partial [Campylobacterales bacterium]
MSDPLLTRAGVPMPKLIYGTAWKKERTAELVKAALHCGFRGIDTACQPKHYREAGVGEALEAAAAEGIARDALFVQTKFTPLEGQDPAAVPYDKNAPLERQVEQSFKTSQANLRSDYVD